VGELPTFDVLIPPPCPSLTRGEGTLRLAPRLNCKVPPLSRWVIASLDPTYDFGQTGLATADVGG
jgi:hypothetical protein